MTQRQAKKSDMRRPSLEEIIEVVAGLAVREFVARTDHDKVGLAHVIGFPRDGAGGPILIGIAMDGPNKAELATAARDTLIKHECDRYAYVTECWVSRRKGDLKPDLQPRDDPDREDGLQILAATADAVMTAVFIIRKIDGAPGGELVRQTTLDSRKRGEGCAGRWAQLVAPLFDPTGQTGYFDHEGFHFVDPMKNWVRS